MKLHTLLLLSILTVFTSCNGQYQKTVDIKSEQTFKTTAGDTVSELDKTIFIVFQANNNDYWFGSDGQGVFRYDGKTIFHFATKDGLCNNRIREIKEDKSGNIFFTTLEGISKFDGQKFTTLPVIESTEWKLEQDNLWFNGPGENGPYRYDGESLYHLEFPKHYNTPQFSDHELS
jgi:ligand-binding sensor domain-containing protein